MRSEPVPESPSEGPKRGRNPVATRETVLAAKELILSQNRNVTVRAVMALVGGSPKRVGALLKELLDFKSSIETTPEVPESLGKLLKTVARDHCVAVRMECERKLNDADEQVRAMHAQSLDWEARYLELKDELETVRSERDVAIGKLDEERVNLQAAVAQLKDDAIERGRSQQLLDDMTDRAQTAQVEIEKLKQLLADCESKLAHANGENAHLKGQSDGMSIHRSSPPGRSTGMGGLQFYTDVSDDDDSPF